MGLSPSVPRNKQSLPMSRFARVTSIEALATLTSALQKFRDDAASGVDELDTEIRRAIEWIHHDRREFWAHELRRAEERVSQARVVLQQARTARRMVDHDPACIDEQRALDRARQRVETARRKIEAVRHCQRAIDQAVDEFRRTRTQFIAWLDTDFVQGIAALGRMTASLESYVSVETAAEKCPSVEGVDVDSGTTGQVGSGTQAADEDKSPHANPLPEGNWTTTEGSP
jgi:hypothetical protein